MTDKPTIKGESIHQLRARLVVLNIFSILVIILASIANGTAAAVVGGLWLVLANAAFIAGHAWRGRRNRRQRSNR